MKKTLWICFLAALFLIPASNVQAQYRKKKPTTEIVKQGEQRRLWLGSKGDTTWRPTPGGLYDEYTNPTEGKKGKKTEPVVDEGSKRKVRETAYDTIWKFFTPGPKTFYYLNYDYNQFRPLKWEKDKDRDWGKFDPVMDYLTSAGRIPMHICAVYAINPSITDQEQHDALAEEARLEAVKSLDYFRDILIEKEMKNKVFYKVMEIDYRYWKAEEFYYQEVPTSDIIRVGLIMDFSSKKIDLFPSAAAGAQTFAEIKFFPNDATIQVSYVEELNNIAAYMKEHTGLEVLLTGYCDNVGTEAYNMGLSRQRAVEVKKALVQRGVQEHRIEIIAKGEDDPVGDNNTYNGRLANNRVKVQLQ